jgi:hypothetical protein
LKNNFEPFNVWMLERPKGLSGFQTLKRLEALRMGIIAPTQKKEVMVSVHKQHG